MKWAHAIGIGSLVFFSSLKGYAFNPLAIAAVAGAGAQAIGNVTDGASEVYSTTSALTELYSELDSAAEMGENAARIIRQINEIDALAQEVKFMGIEAESLNSTSELEKVHHRVKNLTHVIRLGKKAATLVMSLDKRSKHAAVENTEINRELLAKVAAIEAKMEEERLRKEKEDLAKLKAKADEILALV